MSAAETCFPISQLAPCSSVSMRFNSRRIAAAASVNRVGIIERLAEEERGMRLSPALTT